MESIDQKCFAPVFHSIPQDQIIEKGASVIFTFTVQSKLSCWSVWDKNGIVDIPSHRKTIMESSNIKSLKIVNTSLADSGLYRVTVENAHGRVEATVQLEVLDSHTCCTVPTINNAHIRIKRQLMKHCDENNMNICAGLYESTLPATLLVYSNDKILDEKNTCDVSVHNNSVIMIKERNKSDVINYCCILQSKSGKTTGMIAKYDETMNLETLPPIITMHLPPTLTSFEGYETELQINLESNTAFTYVWLCNDMVIEDCHEFRYTDYGHGVLSLRIMDPFVLDSGVYKCIVISHAGSCESKCRVKFVESNSECKSLPQIMLYPQSYVAELGSAVIICAHVTPPNSCIEWKICGSTVEKDMKDLKMKTNADGLHFLFINNINYIHCGEIQCLVPVQNHVMTSRASTILTVIPSISNETLRSTPTQVQEPHFLNVMENLRVFTGTKLSLEVCFNGYPEPQIIWMRAGRPIEDTNASITTKPGNSILTIDGINANQSGKYAAFIINNYGSDTMSASVSVEGPPDPPSGKPSITVDPQGMIVTWCGPPYDGGCVISGFLLEIKCTDNEWNVLAIVFDSLSYVVKNLVPNQSYSIRIRAKNLYGYSEPSLPSDTVIYTSIDNIEKEDIVTNYEVHQGEDFSALYESLEELGRGRFGVVYKVRQKKTSDIRAAKMVKCIKSVDKKKVQEEIAIMRSLQHPKLLQLIQCFEATRETIMVVEYISGGELFERVVADDFTLTEKDCVMFMRQICEGVSYMHNLLVVHLDLKPENIMCSTRSSHQIKIIDFGLAQQLSHNTSVRVLLGTPEFVPPEIINYEPIGLQSDMWSIGVICYVLLSGLSPFMGESDVDTFNNITRAEYDFDDDAFNTVSEEAKDFISGLLLYRKEDRLSAAECLQTKWLSLDAATLANSKICTNKLKKFIVRRKWQKTGNAIRALGRMASLSASRRNSAALTNSGLKSNAWNQEYTTRNQIIKTPKDNL